MVRACKVENALDKEQGAADIEAGAPRVFISYSWTSQEHRDRVNSWVDRIIADGVDVVFDRYDLKEGSDKFAYMERMVVDSSVTHVLVFSDREYARKADDRSDGVGVESQIISEEVYRRVEQSKFVPIVCERDESGDAELPAFLRSRIWIDFSTDEAVNDNWERLVRLLYGRPLHVKPRLGPRPSYLDVEDDGDSGVIRARFASLATAVWGKSGDVRARRDDFLDACVGYADELRVRQAPDEGSLGSIVLEDCRKLTLARDGIVDWVGLEAGIMPEGKFTELLVEVLERLLELKSRPVELGRWQDDWFGAHAVFVYETFLYVVASLLQAGRLEVLHAMFRTHYLKPRAERYGAGSFDRFGAFYGDCGALGETLRPDGRGRYLSAAAELVKRQATRSDIGFDALIEAELLVFLATLVDGDVWWYPGTLHYSGHGQVPDFFIRATRHADFLRLGRIFGVEEADALRRAAHDGWHRNSGRYSQAEFAFRVNPLGMMNAEGWDTLP